MRPFDEVVVTGVGSSGGLQGKKGGGEETEEENDFGVAGGAGMLLGIWLKLGKLKLLCCNRDSSNKLALPPNGELRFMSASMLLRSAIEYAHTLY